MVAFFQRFDSADLQSGDGQYWGRWKERVDTSNHHH